MCFGDNQHGWGRCPSKSFRKVGNYVSSLYKRCDSYNWKVLTAVTLEAKIVQYIAVASIITLVVKYLCLKILGMFERIRALGGHRGICLSWRCYQGNNKS